MIIDIPKFIKEEQKYWSELEEVLNALSKNSGRRMKMNEIRRFHYLHQRAFADLNKLMTFSSDTGIRAYLESLVARSYCEMHETRRHSVTFSPVRWFLKTLPGTFRVHVKAFYFSLAITLLGSMFGVIAITIDPDSKAVIMPFQHLTGNPSERVKQEEDIQTDRLKGQKTTFSTSLMTHNTKVAVFSMSLGITLGIGTIILLFYNGVILGAVAIDYILAGETAFLMGWLLPHGVIEIPAILLSGQAGFMIANAIIGKGSFETLRKRIAAISGDVVTIIAGAAVMLVWAGIIEGFFSQYHEPVLPYSLKIAFGVTELVLLVWFLSRCGMEKKEYQVNNRDAHGE